MPISTNINDFKDILDEHKNYLEDILSYLQKKDFAFIENVFDTKICSVIREYTDNIRQRHSLKNIVLLGTGGSSLGARAAADWQGYFVRLPLDDTLSNFFILDSFDPATWREILGKIDIKETFFMIISKSGKTLEILSQAYFLEEHLEAKDQLHLLKDNVVIVTEPNDTPLLRYAKKHSVKVFDHHTQIGGRFSVLSMTGLLPIFLLGSDGEKLLEGARGVAQRFKNLDYEKNDILHSAAAIALMERENNTKCHVGFFYSDRFAGLGLWMRQLLAESLGKDGKGMLFSRSMGPVDQHGQYQLYAGGPKNKVFTLYKSKDISSAITLKKHHDDEFPYLEGKSSCDIRNSLQSGTLSSLRSLGYKVREISIDQFDLFTLGEIMMGSMIETVIMAKITGVDPFDQPDIENLKKRTRDFLQA